jgi:hypothetical protein
MKEEEKESKTRDEMRKNKRQKIGQEGRTKTAATKKNNGKQ